MTDAQARARVWTLCLYALVLAALTGPVAGLLAPLAHAVKRRPLPSWLRSLPPPSSAAM